MAQRAPLHDHVDSDTAPERFLSDRGIVPLIGRFTERQLSRELTRRGWLWTAIEGRVEATKAHTDSGSVSTHVVSTNPDRVAALALVLTEAIHFDERKGVVLTGAIEADIVIQAPDHRVIAIGEVKGGDSLPRGHAATFRRNLIAHSSMFALAPFFLLIWHDVGYLWDQRMDANSLLSPSLKFPMTPIVRHYLPWTDGNERLSSTEIGLAAARWLGDLASPAFKLEARSLNPFAETDFLNAIQGASIITDALE